MKALKVLSLFDGISCGMVALERANIPVERYVAYEIEPNAIAISKYNYPQIAHKGDVTTADFTQYKGFDLLIGGSPCQSLSIVQSQTRQHLDGKSKLFFEFVRAKEEMQPKYFLFENVASMNEESKTAISNCLGCEPIFIDSGDFSAQERPRLYWTNIPVCLEYKKSVLVLGDVLDNIVENKYYYDYPLLNIDMTKQVCATMDFKNHDMHKRVFNPAFKCHTLTTCGGGNTQKKVIETKYLGNGEFKSVARKLTPFEYEALQTLPKGYTLWGYYEKGKKKVPNTHRYNAIGNGWTVDVIAHILKGVIQ